MPELRSAIAPLIDPVGRFERGDFGFSAELAPYFRDVKNHLLRYAREVEGFRELLTSILTANLTHQRPPEQTTFARSRGGPRSSPCRR